jgi:tetratricopeptide (TPR) repeat protein
MGTQDGFPQTVPGGGAVSLSLSVHFLFTFFARVVHEEMLMPLEPPSVPLWLDLANECLWCGSQARALRPKTFALLRYLVAHPGQVLPKAALLEVLWPATMVSEVVLAVRIRELRRVLDDNARVPRFIETVHRRGYRFIGQLPTAPPAAPHPSSPAPLPLLAGRARELDALHGALATTLTGVRQLLFITGEAGLGKTALVEAFLTALEASGPLWIGGYLLKTGQLEYDCRYSKMHGMPVTGGRGFRSLKPLWYNGVQPYVGTRIGRGQCLDHYGAGEAYLPVLEALGRVCRGPDGQEVVALLEQQAPTWLVQMPGLVCAADLEAVQRRLAGATRDRMLRELAEALERLTTRQPLVLVLEDLHWSDPSTLDVLAMLARRREPARLLLLGTYRLPDALQRGHPLHIVHHELQRHGQCTELPLPLLPEAAVATYLATRFPEAHLPAGLARLVHQRTEGHPLFMVTVVEEWVRRGWLVPADGAWTLRGVQADVARLVPESLRQMLEQQLERLSPRDQRVLEVGSVAGATFSAAAVAAGLAYEVAEVDDWCAGLARRQQWLEACGEQVWPDGTVAGNYRFTHALYQEVVYHRLSAARRVQLHCRIGAREEAGYGPRVRERAAVLAMHFVRGQDAQRAVPYLQYAGENALRRSAYAEARQHLTTGLEILATMPETPTRHRHELDLLIPLTWVLRAAKSLAPPELEPVLTRAEVLAQQVGELSQHGEVLHALFNFRNARLECQAAHAVAEQLLDLAQRQHDLALLMGAHNALGQSWHRLGAYTLARTHFEQAIALDDAQRHTSSHTAPGWPWPMGVNCRAIVARVLWALGYPDQAIQRSQEALTMAHALASPSHLSETLHHSIALHIHRQEWQTVEAYAEAMLALATKYEFVRFAAQGVFYRGMVLAAQGQGAEGISQMRQGLATVRAVGHAIALPRYLTYLAEVCGQVGQVDEGLHLLAEALAMMDTTGERSAEAELHRLHGELLLQQPVRAVQAAEACFQQAITVAQRQQAMSWELQAAICLSRLWQCQGQRAKAHALLAPIYGWFTEGFDTADLQEAKALLEALV